MPKHETFVAMAVRDLIDKELAYFKDEHGQPPENQDVRKGLERAEIAISRAFRKFYSLYQ